MMAKAGTKARKPKRKPEENGVAVLPLPALADEHLDKCVPKMFLVRLASSLLFYLKFLSERLA